MTPKKTCIVIAFMLIKPLVVFFNLAGNSMNVLPHKGLEIEILNFY